MQFTVGDWMLDVVIFVEPDASVAEALSLMRRRYTQSVIVNKTETNPEYGIVTSTDICDKIVAQERNPSLVKVREIMTSPLITVFRSTPLKECALLMKQKKIHHLPVMDDEDECPIGVISANDFLVAAEAMGKAPGERII